MSLSPEDKKLIGASDVGAIFQVSDWSGWVSLWARICRGYDWGGNRSTEEGTLSEDYHRRLYRLHTGYELEGPPPATLRHPLLPWARCSPDDTALGTPEGRRGVEFKQSRRSEGWGVPGSEEVPPAYWLQAQFQGGFCLEVSYWDTADVDVSALLFGDRRSHPVQHQPEVWERIQAACERFWRDFVVPDRCPEGPNMRMLERDSEALLACFPAPTPGVAALPWDALTGAQQVVVQRWLEANSARKKWEKEEAALARQVRHILREAPGLIHPGGRIDFVANEQGRALVARGAKK